MNLCDSSSRLLTIVGRVEACCEPYLRARFEAHKQRRNRARETATDIHKWSAVKSPLGAQTVLGDRHDLVCEILLQVPSAACGTRPRELSNGWARIQIRATDIHKCSAVKSPLGAQTVLGDRHDLVCEFLLQVPSAACGTRPRELSNGWKRKRMRASTAASSL